MPKKKRTSRAGSPGNPGDRRPARSAGGRRRPARKARPKTLPRSSGSAVRKAGLVLLFACLAGFCYLLLLRFPQGFFRYETSAGNILLHSDRPLAGIASSLLAEVSVRLSRSPLDDLSLTHEIFICNSPWRFLLFANRNYRVGGVNYIALGRNVFLRPAMIERNRLISPGGYEVRGERTLVYYMTHELTHGMMVRHVGVRRYLRLPVWLKEGYADYVARPKLDMKKSLLALRRGSIEMDPVRSGLYLRWHLAVAFLLDARKIGLERLLDEPPSLKEVEKLMLAPR